MKASGTCSATCLSATAQPRNAGSCCSGAVKYAFTPPPIAEVGLVMVLLWVIGSSLCEAFPIEQFKDFVNNKPTIENFTFEVSTTKFKLGGLNPKIFRHFTFVMQNEDIYRLTEDKSGYFMEANYGRTEFTNKDGMRMLPYVPQQQASWGRYENQFWNTFNLSDVITTTIQSSNAIPEFGPARGSEAMVRIAYDALNLGIMDLRSIGVTWSNLDFTCPSNVIGLKVSGHLELADSGMPKDAVYTLSNDSGTYHYQASYYFATNSDLPDYMPSRIQIAFLKGSSPVLMSDYKILKLATSSQPLSVSDVALVATTNTQEYIYTNKEFYHIKTNEWVRIGSSTEIEQPGLRRKQVVIIILAIVFFIPLIFLLFRHFVTHKNNRNKKCHEK